jgi:S-adenosylmethionine:tRNA ribosyltransferase-isomerase
MHSEWGEVPQATADAIADAKRVVSIGTTALRLLESVARDGPMRAWTGETDIFITPGFQFRAVDVLLTNFHLPRSTLFMLVSAFAGLERMKAAYAHAVAKRYRFYSYGDCCLLHR